MKRSLNLLLALGAGTMVVGCNSADTLTAVPPAPTVASTTPELTLGPLPGMAVPTVSDPNSVFASQAKLVASKSGTPRKDPFALTSTERAFDVNQTTARLSSELGAFPLVYEVPVDPDVNQAAPILEPQPYRRLSGIIVGDSVYAILEGGATPEIIRPGMRVPGTEWTVVSIDLEKAVLRRSGNVLPHTIIVRLESPPPGMGGATNPGMGGTGRPGGPPGPGMGGPPGGPPGRPGGPGMGGPDGAD